MSVERIVSQLVELSDPEIAQHSQRFFKTADNEYGAGDKFLGIRVPVIRKVVKQWRKSELTVALALMKNEYHEIRLFAVLLMVALFEQAKNDTEKQQIVDAYLTHTQYVNNWDLVDSSAHKILGKYLLDKNDRSLLFTLAKSDCLWQRRIAMMATYFFIKQGQFDETFKIADMLLDDTHDLIHKIVGWMLREVGNKDRQSEEDFLKTRYQKMPRTMLRYAIEKFPQPRRQEYLTGSV